MSGYVFVDWNNDGKFDSAKGLVFNSNRPERSDDCEVVSFSAHDNGKTDRWYNSNGKSFDKSSQFPKDDNVKNWLGSFKVPADLKEPNFSAINGIDDVKVSKEELLENDVYNLNGQLVRRAGSKKALPLGVYVVKGKKFIVK